MMSTNCKSSNEFLSTRCVSEGCEQISELECLHCSQSYCYLCFMCHRKNLLDDMHSISEQMLINRRQGVAEVVTFINRQAQDAHQQAKRLLDDAIERIRKASVNMFNYIEKRRQAKLRHIAECLQQFHRDENVLQWHLSRQICLSAAALCTLRRQYASTMFDQSLKTINKSSSPHERFFDNYRFYNDLINLRQRWPYLQAALTTVYFPAKKFISLDDILTFLEYRHDRVLDNYRAHLTSKQDLTDAPIPSNDELMQQLSFLRKKPRFEEIYNFISIRRRSIVIHNGNKCNDKQKSLSRDRSIIVNENVLP